MVHLAVLSWQLGLFLVPEGFCSSAHNASGSVISLGLNLISFDRTQSQLILSLSLLSRFFLCILAVLKICLKIPKQSPLICFSSGVRVRAAATARWKLTPAMIRKAPLHPYHSRSLSAKTGMIIIPAALPAVVRLKARENLVGKYSWIAIVIQNDGIE